MRQRLWWSLTASAILGAGLGVRAFTGGAFAKYAGIALYAALVYALVAWLFPRLAPQWTAVAATGFCWLVELAQLTPWPAELSERSVIARLVLGSTFNPPDLFWYFVGAAVLFGAHAVAVRSVTST
ncbi:membrane protein [Virgisporangium aliadipatigenens]|uniref:Membrane protein n=1 Tax=Virgisporangium aliadipatigenens TaxID=741659 RepID=A0A8J3YU68_9ACTN|nr:DUF2809 domain-containing protein [Virgisporangium aliadipatigenens]GIJ49940.1 membrane protein [Virgisporangium aliadipatigenens]